MTLYVGTSTVVQIPFSAHPKPEVTWMFNDKKVCDSGDVRYEMLEEMTSLVLTNVKRSDAGFYSVILENEFGKCTGIVNVAILGTHTFSIVTLEQYYINYLIC